MHYFKNEKENILDFLNQLAKNNNRPWFNSNKNFYTEAKEDFASFILMLQEQLITFDETIKAEPVSNYIFRIHRDVRFSNDKTPYKPNFGAYIANGGRKSKYAGYYVHFENDKSFIAAGIYSPQKDELFQIRKHIQLNSDEFLEIINKAEIKERFGELRGDKLTTSPRDFDKDDPMIDYINHKSFNLMRNYSNDEIVNDDFIKNILIDFKTLQEFNRFLNDAIE